MIRMAEKRKKIVPDTSILISGILSDMIKKGELKETEIIIPEFVVEELRAQASRGREIGFKGLEEIKRIREFEKEHKLVITRTGRKQTYEEIQLAKYGRIDALILDVAKNDDATLYTSDFVQSTAAEADGVKVKYYKPYEKKTKLKIEGFMTEDTMSLHLKEGTLPRIKKGKPGDFKLVRAGDKISAEQLEEMIKEIMDAVRYEDDSFIEIGGHKASVVQLGNMRIAIARPPFSDGIEITVVRPIVKLTLDDYKLSEKLKQRLFSRAEGILIAGPPGSGKSTFAASLAEFYEKEKKAIVKTMESPRDLQVGPEITQYTKLGKSFEDTADMLLLVRPDYTIFDEVRKTQDFEIFADMRLAGIGMVGVVHATNPVDAVQRFMGRIELGMIPHVIDTIIYIKAGKIEAVYCLSLIVRTPTGMTEADLARPVVEVRDFETNELKYEIYTYGEENFIIPVKAAKESAVNRLARQQMLSVIRKFDDSADVEIMNDNKAVIRVENDVIPRIIGTKGKTIKQLEERLGISIEVMPKVSTLGKEINFEKEETGAYLVFVFLKHFSGKIANLYADGDYIMSATIGKSGQIRVAKDSDVGKDVLKALVKNALKVFV